MTIAFTPPPHSAQGSTHAARRTGARDDADGGGDAFTAALAGAESESAAQRRAQSRAKDADTAATDAQPATPLASAAPAAPSADARFAVPRDGPAQAAAGTGTAQERSVSSRTVASDPAATSLAAQRRLRTLNGASPIVERQMRSPAEVGGTDAGPVDIGAALNFPGVPESLIAGPPSVPIADPAASKAAAPPALLATLPATSDQGASTTSSSTDSSRASAANGIGGAAVTTLAAEFGREQSPAQSLTLAETNSARRLQQAAQATAASASGADSPTIRAGQSARPALVQHDALLQKTGVDTPWNVPAIAGGATATDGAVQGTPTASLQAAAAAGPTMPLVERPLVEAGIAARVGTPAWTGETAQKIAHFVFARNESIELRVDPVELGPIAIRVDLKGDQASVSIVAAHADTRQALEQALPQLRELLADGGITLFQADVQGGSAGRHPEPEARPNRPGSDRTAPDPAAEPAGAPPAAGPTAPSGRRLIDVFA
ncbi:MAG: flagellar hook-length control protein FliK [Betaproteobacteria bacterium]